MRDSRLPLANPGNGEAAIGHADREMQAGGAALCRKAPGKICIREKVWLPCTWPVPHPSHQLVIIREIDVADKAMEAPVAKGARFCEEARPVRYCL